MSKNVKVKGENVKELTFEVKDLNLDERCEFNNIVTKTRVADLCFGDYVAMVRLATTFDDEKLNDFTDTEIIGMAWKCYEVVNKKKLKK